MRRILATVAFLAVTGCATQPPLTDGSMYRVTDASVVTTPVGPVTVSGDYVLVPREMIQALMLRLGVLEFQLEHMKSILRERWVLNDTKGSDVERQ